MLGSSDFPARCVDHPRLRVVWSLRRLLGVAPHANTHADGLGLDSAQHRRDAPLREAMLVTGGFERRTTLRVKGNTAGQRDPQEQNASRQARSTDRPCGPGGQSR